MQTTDVIAPELGNAIGLLHGPDALEIMGQAAFACASKAAGCDVIMAKADNIEFRKPLRPGDAVTIRSEIAFRGHSSMTVLVDIATGGAAAVSGRFMMVAVDKSGVPIRLPEH